MKVILMHKEVSDYLASLEAQFYSKSRQHQVRFSLGHLILFLKEHSITARRGRTPENATWQAVSERDLIAFATWAANDYKTREGKQMAAQTLAWWLSCVRSFFVWMQKEGRVLANPAVFLPAPIIGDALPKILSEDQIAGLMKMPNLSTQTGLRDRALMELFYATGVRRAEAVALDLYDLDLCTEQIFVRQGKGYRDRVVPLTAQACHWLSRYLTDVRPRFSGQSGTDDSAFFLSRQGRRLTGDSMAWHVGRYIKRAKLKGSLHTFRHCFATHLIWHGASVRMVQKLLGHKSLDVTERYTHLNFSDLKTAIRSSK